MSYFKEKDIWLTQIQPLLLARMENKKKQAYINDREIQK